MAKIQKFKVERLPIQVEYKNAFLGRFIGLYSTLKFIRFIKFNLTVGSKPIDYFYRLYIPRLEVIK